MNLQTLQNMTLSQKLGLVDQIEAWCKAVREEAFLTLRRGEPVEGYKLVQGKRGNRKWVHEKTVESHLLNLGVNEEIYNKELKSPSQLEKTFSESAFRPLKDFITQSEGPVHIAPADDPRPEVKVDKIEDDFQDLTDATGGLA
jgi:hypothetical protein